MINSGNTTKKKISTAYRLDEVLMENEYCTNSFEKEVAYLLKLNTDKLLAGFRETAGLDLKGAKRYGGWEDSLIGGHTLGHYLTACAQAYANAQVKPSDKEKLNTKITALIDGLLECQNHSRGHAGFVFGARIVNADNVEQQFDNVEENKTDIKTEAWVPWYTMHKIIEGIVNVYKLTGNENALHIASNLGDWVCHRVSRWSDAVRRTVLQVEYGGMNDCLYELYLCTGKENHLEAAHIFDEDSLFERVVSGKANVLNNCHANTTIPKFLGALNRYIAIGEQAYLYLEYAKSFWDMVVERHTYITGGNSEWEHFGEDYVLDKERTNTTNETCNTYNMLKLTRKLFMITGDKKYADYYENTLINAILSSQNPKTGMSMYFQPMATGYFKVYSTEFTKFWCCTGTGMENFTKLNDSIYFHHAEGIIINLYFSSSVTDKVLGMTVKQESDIPNSGTAVFRVTAEQKDAALSFRVPDWAVSTKVTLNGAAYDFAETDGYITIQRQWNTGDVVSITFGMEITAYTLPDHDSVYAFKYGPIVLSAGLGNEELTEGVTGEDVTIPENKIVKNEFITINREIGSADTFLKNINSHFEKEDGALRFTLKDTDQALVFSPHYSKASERYGIYWYLIDAAAGNNTALDKN